ncbi:uncharacterized protein LOC110727388 [Chenopodium quinoa]|uniref:uncharacterized protein LOC110727388 n=1 Tax=Chenopodium quinoa TaxID=63459 RepID=UPI000B7897E4|nr:uncharacterized protein LOC110727388 [Chenopodium quinoa]
MADDQDRVCVEDVEDDDDDFSRDGDELYDVNKEPDLGEAEDQAQDELERRLDAFEMEAEQAPPIENAVSETVGENATSHNQSQGQSGGGVRAPAKKKVRGPTTSFKKPVGPMVLEYDKAGQRVGKFCRPYAIHVGICARKIPITLRMREVPPHLIDTFWNDTRSLFNISNDAAKRRVFESLLAERFRGFKSELVRCWITNRKKKPKKKKGNDDEVINEELLPWQKWPNISKDDWEAFVIQQSTKEAIELREQNSKNAKMKQYTQRMGCKTFGEWRETWVNEGVYPTSLLGSSKGPSSSTITTLVSRAGDFFCSLHARDKETGKWAIKAPETKEMADKLIEHTEELVEGKLVPSVEKDPFTLALGKPYHPGRVVGAGGSLLGWEKVMGPEYTKSGRS